YLTPYADKDASVDTPPPHKASSSAPHSRLAVSSPVRPSLSWLESHTHVFSAQIGLRRIPRFPYGMAQSDDRRRQHGRQTQPSLRAEGEAIPNRHCEPKAKQSRGCKSKTGLLRRPLDSSQ